MSIPTTRMTTSAGYVTSDCLSEEYSRRRIYITGEKHFRKRGIGYEYNYGCGLAHFNVWSALRCILVYAFNDKTRVAASIRRLILRVTWRMKWRAV